MLPVARAIFPRGRCHECAVPGEGLEGSRKVVTDLVLSSAQGVSRSGRLGSHPCREDVPSSGQAVAHRHPPADLVLPSRRRTRCRLGLRAGGGLSLGRVLQQRGRSEMA
jgi:hypothetical protein